jgi:hypothetical protein
MMLRIGRLKETEAALKRDIKEVETALKRDIKDVEARLEAKLAETKAELIKWLVGLLFVQAGFIIAMLKLGDFSKRTSRTRLPPLGESECPTWVTVDCAPSALLPHASPPCSVTRLFGRSCG